MTVEPEVQQEFDKLMGHARKVGSMLADTVITGAPPPWDERWFERMYGNATEQAGNAFRDMFPRSSDVVIANMQVRFQEGFEGRLHEVLPNLSRTGGTA